MLPCLSSCLFAAVCVVALSCCQPSVHAEVQKLTEEFQEPCMDLAMLLEGGVNCSLFNETASLLDKCLRLKPSKVNCKLVGFSANRFDLLSNFLDQVSKHALNLTTPKVQLDAGEFEFCVNASSKNPAAVLPCSAVLALQPIRPVTDPPVTDPPVTDPPVTDPPVTDPPVTDPPVPDPPVTDPPVIDPPVTDPVSHAECHAAEGFAKKQAKMCKCSTKPDKRPTGLKPQCNLVCILLKKLPRRGHSGHCAALNATLLFRNATDFASVGHGVFPDFLSLNFNNMCKSVSPLCLYWKSLLFAVKVCLPACLQREEFFSITPKPIPAELGFMSSLRSLLRNPPNGSCCLWSAWQNIASKLVAMPVVFKKKFDHLPQDISTSNLQHCKKCFNQFPTPTCSMDFRSLCARLVATQLLSWEVLPDWTDFLGGGATNGAVQPTASSTDGTVQLTTHDSTNGTVQPTTHDSTNGTVQPTTHNSTNGTVQPSTGTSTVQPSTVTPGVDATTAGSTSTGHVHSFWLFLLVTSIVLLGLMLYLARDRVMPYLRPFYSDWKPVPSEEPFPGSVREAFRGNHTD